MQGVFIAEDDDNIRELVIYALGASGFPAEGFIDGQSMLSAVEKAIPDLILLDIMLPGLDGLSILKVLKASEKTRDIPVIMLTAKGSEYDRIRGLDLGADDYITKPFSIMEAISRVRAVLRRSGAVITQPDELVTSGGIMLSEKKREVTAKGMPVILTFKEFELLRHLMLNENMVQSRSMLLDRIWGFEYAGESRTVDMHIKTLRQKLGECGECIKTVRGVGYKLEGQS